MRTLHTIAVLVAKRAENMVIRGEEKPNGSRDERVVFFS